MLPGLSMEPEGAAALCIMALNMMTQDEAAGTDCLKALNPDVPQSSLRLAESQLRHAPYLIRSLFLGTSPENRYTLPEMLEIEFTTNIYSGTPGLGQIKLFAACSGADSPRPITVSRRENGSWYASEWSSLIVGIRPPADLS